MSEQPKPTSVVETLRLARAKIEDPKHWTKGALARPSKRSGVEVLVRASEAGAWCALGALFAVDGPFETDARALLAEVIEGRATDSSGFIWRFNDEIETRHRDVMRAYDKAIALAEKRATQ